MAKTKRAGEAVKARAVDWTVILAGIPDLPLGDEALPLELAAARPSGVWTADAGAASAAFGAAGEVRIEAFNAVDDVDADGVLGAPAEEPSAPGAAALGPQLLLSDDAAWLKYRLAARPMARGAARGLELAAGPETVLADYRGHGREENARAAVRADLAAPRLAVHAADILLLGPRDALAWRVRGELSLRLTVGWAPLWRAALGAVARLLPPERLLAVEAAAGAAADFAVTLGDDFQVVFTRPAPGRVRVAVQKIEARGAAAGAPLGLQVALDGGADLAAAAESAWAAVCGGPVGRIEKILKRASLEELGEAERALLEQVLERVRLGRTFRTLGAVARRWTALRGRVEAAVAAAAEAQAAAGFRYEYLRLNSGTTLFQAVLDDADFRACHPALVQLDLSPVLETARAHPDRAALERFLREDVRLTRRAWGLAVALGPWAAAGRDVAERRHVVQRDGAGRERVALSSRRRYEAAWGRRTAAWTADFSAEMPEFAAAGRPAADEFRFALRLQWEWGERKIARADLAEALDLAMVWGAVTPAGAAEVAASLEAELSAREPATLGVALELDDATLRALLPRLAAGGDAAAARALARAMPRLERYAARREPDRREALYAPLWREYLRRNREPLRAYAAAARRHVAAAPGGKHLALREGGGGTRDPLFGEFHTFAGQIRYHGATAAAGDHAGIAQAWRRLRRGLARLEAALAASGGDGVKAVDAALADAAPFWGQSLLARAGGAYFVALAAAEGKLGQVARTLTIELPLQERTVVVTTSAEGE
ncbi:MAG TPA: hypothetical protein PKM55_10715 [Acidobacteriota bacterium]|nr:hypothetical protein [Acidobacteriota bacterium]